MDEIATERARGAGDWLLTPLELAVIAALTLGAALLMTLGTLIELAAAAPGALRRAAARPRPGLLAAAMALAAIVFLALCIAFAAAIPPAAAMDVSIDPRGADPGYSWSESLTVGTPVAATFPSSAPPGAGAGVPIRALLAVCTAAGNITVALANSGTPTLYVTVGTNLIPLAATEVVSQVATCAYSALG